MEVSTPDSNISNNHQVRSEVASREDIQAAFAKAAELRTIHAALFKGTSSTNSSFLPSPPFQRPKKPTCSSANDYPVFTPSYEEEPLPGYQQLHLASQALKENWGDYVVGEADEHDISQSNNTMKNAPPAPRKGYLSPGLVGLNPPDDQESRSMTSCCTNHHQMSVVLQNSPLAHEVVKLRRRNSLGDLNSVSSSFSRCRLSNNGSQNCHKHSSNTVAVPLTDSHSMVANPEGSKSRGVMLSWLFPRSKKKDKSGKKSSEGGSQIVTDKSGVVILVEALKKELIEAKQMRDLAIGEAEEVRCSFEDLKQKLENLEKHCEELEKGLAQGGVDSNGSRVEKVGSLQLPEKGKSCEENDGMPVSEEVMVEGFVQIVSEARLSVKHFCKQVVGQLEEGNDEPQQQVVEKHLNCLLQPYKLSVKSKHTKSVVYHLEAIVNRALYEDFENCVFQKNGTPKLLDPQQARLAQFSSFVGLRNLSWNEVLKKGTKYYSAELSKFCDQKMSIIISTLGWNIPWPEQLLQSFFVAAKCIWLLHLLAFSFSPPLTILRVEENRQFDSLYMEDMLTDRQRSRCPTRVKIMAMPGFYVQDRVLKCKVLCSYR